MKFRSFDKYTSITKENVPYLRPLSADVSQSPYRPKAHICPPCGLLNDPNGLCWYEGYYHVFYQWYPFGPSHGMKHWAHVKSKDFGVTRFSSHQNLTKKTDAIPAMLSSIQKTETVTSITLPTIRQVPDVFPNRRLPS